MFEEVLVITLLIAIFFVVFYIIYNNKCGCNKNLIENFEKDEKDGTYIPRLPSPTKKYIIHSEDLDYKFEKIDTRIEEINSIINQLNNDDTKRELIQSIIQDELNKDGRLKENIGNNIDDQKLQEINETIEEFRNFKNNWSGFFETK